MKTLLSSALTLGLITFAANANALTCNGTLKNLIITQENEVRIGSTEMYGDINPRTLCVLDKHQTNPVGTRAIVPDRACDEWLENLKIAKEKNLVVSIKYDGNEVPSCDNTPYTHHQAPAPTQIFLKY